MSKSMGKLLTNLHIESGQGTGRSGVFSVMNGINHRGVGNLVPGNYDSQGLTFFTRPNLNLSYDNVLSVRRLSHLGDMDNRNMGGAIRCLLSPNLNNKSGTSTEYGDGGSQLPRSQIIDDSYAFIPVLSNTMLNNSGWNDTSMESYSSKEGLRKEVIGWADGPPVHYGEWDLTTTFQNIDGNPVTGLITAWIVYQGNVKLGVIAPYPECIVQKRIDYNTRIYRLILDNTKQWVRGVATCGAAYPTGVNDGSQFNYSADTPGTEGTNSISVRWKCYGTRINDPIDLINFNNVVSMFNPSMRDSVRERRMVKLLPEEKLRFNYTGYPRISPTNELEWWVLKGTYKSFYSELDIIPPKR